VGLTHHELCYGCGIANVFGLQMEAERDPGGGVTGRFFLKQDHQGPPGLAHPGVIALALEEAMSLALAEEGVSAFPRSLELRLEDPPPVGVFVHVSARVESAEGESVPVSARAEMGGSEARTLATARAVFVASSPG
jgi:acyl-coenzyme A thioesterase PaaI-like protein